MLKEDLWKPSLVQNSPEMPVALTNPTDPRSVVGGGVFIRSIVPRLLADEVDRLLVRKNFTAVLGDLTRCHEHIFLKENLETDSYALNPVSTAFYKTSEYFLQCYRVLVENVRCVLGVDILFQKIPTVRFHFPGRFMGEYRTKDGVFLGHHSDTMLGHPFGELNCWVPLTNCAGTAALQLLELKNSILVLEQVAKDINWDDGLYQRQGHEEFHKRFFTDLCYQSGIVSRTKPVPMTVGQVLIFDSRCIHATAENQEGVTRVSLDFRVIPVDRYNEIRYRHRSQGRSGRYFERGDIFDEKSVDESVDES